MRERHHRAVAIQLQRQHGVIRHVASYPRLRQIPGVSIFIARIAHGHVNILHLRHDRQATRQLPGTDVQHTPARTMHGHDTLVVMHEHIPQYLKNHAVHDYNAS